MKVPSLILCLFSFWLALPSFAAQPTTRRSGFDALGSFTVDAEIPAGSRHVVLEIASELSPATNWRPMIAGAIDGRAARVTFRLPPQPNSKLFARVKTGSETTLPPVELSGELLYWATYADHIDSQTKIDFFGAATAKMREWLDLPRAQSQANQIAWALANPIVEAAEVSPFADNVCIRFKDGTILTLLNRPRFSNDPPQAPLAKKDVKEWPSLPVLNFFDAPSMNLPESNAAVTAFSLESGFPNSAPTICNWLNSHNYRATNYDSTTIGQLVQWSAAKPLGVLFWQAHGYSYKKKDGSEGIGIVTRETATKAKDEGPYAALMKSGVLGLAGDHTQTAPYYAATSEFFRKHVRFAPNSIVVIDACYGGHPELAAGILDAGAGSFASWDWLSGNYSGTPCLKVFDRLLGMNEEPPIMLPKERPFSLPVIEMWMKFFQYDFDPSPQYPGQGRPNAKLTWFHDTDHPGYILRPTVMRVLKEAAGEDEPYTKFFIEGDFGSDPGESKREILWGGVKMQKVRWEPGGITIRMPSAPPVGNIQIKMFKDFMAISNPVPITEWTVPFTYEIVSESSLRAKLEMNVKFRADVHGSRGMPEMPVEYLPIHFSNMADCTGTVSASGIHHPNASTTVVWSGGSSLTSLDPNAENHGPFNKLISNHGTIEYRFGKITPFHLTADGDFTETRTVRHPDGTVTTQVSRPAVVFAGFGYPPPAMPLNPGNLAFIGNTIVYPGQNGSAKLSWPNITPQMAPDIDTIR